LLVLIGFSEEEIKKLAGLDNVLPVSSDNLNMLLGEFLTAPPEGEYKKVEGSRIVIMHDIPKEKIGATMRSVRSAVAGHVIFATTTPTSLTWKIKDLIEELEEEDRYFRGKH